MAGNGPPPKPDGQRRRRNKPAAGTTLLPRDGNPKKQTPGWPFPGAPPKRWSLLWSLPEAAMWGPSDVLILARYVRSCLLFEKLQSLAIKTGDLPTGMTSLQSEIRQCEANYGMNPAAKLRLRLQLAPDEVGEKRDEQHEAAASGVRARLSSVKAVDDAVAGT